MHRSACGKRPFRREADRPDTGSPVAPKSPSRIFKSVRDLRASAVCFPTLGDPAQGHPLSFPQGAGAGKGRRAHIFQDRDQ